MDENNLTRLQATVPLEKSVLDDITHDHLLFNDFEGDVDLLPESEEPNRKMFLKLVNLNYTKTSGFRYDKAV